MAPQSLSGTIDGMMRFLEEIASLKYALVGDKEAHVSAYYKQDLNAGVRSPTFAHDSFQKNDCVAHFFTMLTIVSITATAPGKVRWNL